MKIPNKINRATYTKLNKQNLKSLLDEINSQHHDLLLEANWLSDRWLPDNKFHDDMAEEHKNTLASWHKDVKAEFRLFKADRVKIQKAYDKFVAAAAKKKSKK